MTNTFEIEKSLPLEKLIPLIDWNFFFTEWDLPGRFPDILDHPERGAQARDLYDEALAELRDFDATASYIYSMYDVSRRGDDILVKTCECCAPSVVLPMLRNQTSHFGSLADYVEAQNDIITPFALCVRPNFTTDDPYRALMIQILCDRLADALSTYLTQKIETLVEKKTLPMAIGYPAVPDHSLKRTIFELLGVEQQLPLRLTENFSMSPTSSVCGLMVSHPDIKYFSVGFIGDDQVTDYARRAGLTEQKLRSLIPGNLLTLAQ